MEPVSLWIPLGLDELKEQQLLEDAKNFRTEFSTANSGPSITMGDISKVFEMMDKHRPLVTVIPEKYKDLPEVQKIARSLPDVHFSPYIDTVIRFRKPDYSIYGPMPLVNLASCV